MDLIRNDLHSLDGFERCADGAVGGKIKVCSGLRGDPDLIRYGRPSIRERSVGDRSQSYFD